MTSRTMKIPQFEDSSESDISLVSKVDTTNYSNSKDSPNPRASSQETTKSDVWTKFGIEGMNIKTTGQEENQVKFSFEYDTTLVISKSNVESISDDNHNI